MAETLVFVGVAFVVVAIAGTVFFAWLVVAILRGVFRLVGGLAAPKPPPRRTVVLGPRMLPSPPAPPAPAPPGRVVVCGHVRCRASNPADAHFCRRCGKMIRPVPEAVAARASTGGAAQVAYRELAW